MLLPPRDAIIASAVSTMARAVFVVVALVRLPRRDALDASIALSTWGRIVTNAKLEVVVANAVLSSHRE